MNKSKMSKNVPSIKSLASELISLKSYLRGKDDELEIRLNVQDGGWVVRMGDPSYDQDHRGAWGAGYLTRSTNCRDLARSLIDEVEEHIAQMGDEE